MTNNIEDYCDEIEENVNRIYDNTENYSDEVLDLADDFRDAASEIRNDAEAANEKYFELKDRAEEQNEEIRKCYQALEKMATIEEQHQKTRRWIGGGVLAILTGGAIGTGILASSGADTSRDRPEFQAGESYSLGEPDNFDSVIEGDSDFYDWLEDVDYETEDLGAQTFSTPRDGIGAEVRELESYDEDNDLAVLGSEVLGELEPGDINQSRVGQ